MELSTDRVINRIRSDFDSVSEYDGLVDAWEQLCEEASNSTDGELLFADVEKAAISALSADPSRRSGSREKGNIGDDISRMINAFDYPTYLVSSHGIIASANLAAWKEFRLDAGESIDQLPFLIDGSETLARLLTRELRTEVDDTEPRFLLKRSHAKHGEQDATIAISVSRGKNPTALIFVITTRWKPSSIAMLQQHFGLTRTEAGILIHFIDGYSTQDIARLRQRSHHTIRAQFQSIREKLGARNQTELLRTALSVSDFSNKVDEITYAVEHPHRRKTENITTSGRVVEATLMGDFNGDTVIMIASGSHYTFNAEFEEMLYENGLRVISVCPPGYGKTDRAPEDTPWVKQIGEDIQALLKQLEITQCVLLISHTNAPASYRISRQISAYLTHIVHLSTCGPARYDKGSDARSTWVSGIVKACTANSAIKHILLKGAVKAWVTLGARKFIQLQMSSNPVDKKFATLPENLEEYEHALEVAVSRGPDNLMNEQELVFDDWTDDVKAAPVEITAIHGTENKLFRIECVRELVKNIPGKMDLIEVKKAGFTLTQSHPEKIVSLLRSIVDSHQAVKKQYSNLARESTSTSGYCNQQ